MTQYYWVNKKDGYMIPESFLFDDACLSGYNNITDPCSPEYGNYNLYYEKTSRVVR